MKRHPRPHYVQRWSVRLLLQLLLVRLKSKQPESVLQKPRLSEQLLMRRRRPRLKRSAGRQLLRQQQPPPVAKQWRRKRVRLQRRKAGMEVKVCRPDKEAEIHLLVRLLLLALARAGRSSKLEVCVVGDSSSVELEGCRVPCRSLSLSPASRSSRTA